MAALNPNGEAVTKRFKLIDLQNLTGLKKQRQKLCVKYSRLQVKSRVRKNHNCVYLWKMLLTFKYICIILESIITGSYFFHSTSSQTALRRDFSYVMSSCLRCWFLLIVQGVAPGLIYCTLFKPGSRELLISLCVFSMGLSLHCPRASLPQDHLFPHTSMRGEGIFIPILWMNDWTWC